MEVPDYRFNFAASNENSILNSQAFVPTKTKKIFTISLSLNSLCYGIECGPVIVAFRVSTSRKPTFKTAGILL